MVDLREGRCGAKCHDGVGGCLAACRNRLQHCSVQSLRHASLEILAAVCGLRRELCLSSLGGLVSRDIAAGRRISKESARETNQ